MNKEKILKAFKILVILFLVMAISILVLLNWKSDLIIDKVLDAVQKELVDSLQYSDATLDLFCHFPSTAIQISDLSLGSDDQPLIRGGEIDVVIGLMPLLKGNILVNQLHVSGATIYIENRNGRWSYDILKETEEKGDSTFNTQIRELQLNQTRLHYDDGEGMAFALEISNGLLEGGYDQKKLDLSMDLESTLTSMTMGSYELKAPFSSNFKGEYVFDMQSGLQELKAWSLENEAILLTAEGTILREKDHEVLDVGLAWEKGDPEAIKKWLPQEMLRTWSQYRFSGSFSGTAILQGKSSEKISPHITSTARLKNGAIRFLSSAEEIKGLDLEINYDHPPAKAPAVNIRFEKDAMMGNSLNGNIGIHGLKDPVVDISVSGTLPVNLLNLLEIEGLHFEKGKLDIDDFKLPGFRTSQGSLAYFISHGQTALDVHDLSLTYLNNIVRIPGGRLKLSAKKLEIAFEEFAWNKAITSDLKGEITSAEDQLEFDIRGNLCEGQVETKGNITGIKNRPVSHSTWKVSGIEMKKLLESFSNFDQTFITSENLEGKTNIWATSVLPFDEKWNLLTKSVQVRGAIEIKDGRLKGMKTLEDFSDYVHLSDLQDIRFNQLRNYMKIENGIVSLPFMFIQSTALNMSISGEHSFDQDILYYLKLNAGQVAASKLKKNEGRKELKPARKSGWINLYFILSGTPSNVRYQQDRTGVVAGFERTTMLKEELRNYLVDKFGYDVYWLEPNEWEDIPEYQ